MKILIVEDETAACENLAAIMASIDPCIEIVGYTESICQTVDWLSCNAPPDLILMDIHLSDGSAFTIFSETEVETPVIFTTAYDEYALEAFAVNSIDYLLKPVKVEEMERALAKFKRLTRREIECYTSQTNALASAERSRCRYRDKMLIPVKDKLVPVDMKEIAYFYTTNRNTLVCLKNGVQHPYSRTLEHIGDTLDPADFIRANKQFIISRDSVRNITIWFDSRLLVTLDAETPERLYISKNKAAEFKNWLVNEI